MELQRGNGKKSGEMTSNNNGGAEERENINCFVPSAATRRGGGGTGMAGRGWGRVLLVINEMH